MEFYEVITDAYANVVIVWNDLPGCLRTLLPFMKVK